MRLFYKAAGFKEGITVTGYFIQPDLSKTAMLAFTELYDGIYYLDFDFAKCGPYCGIFFENTIPSIVQVFRQGRYPGIIEYK